MNNHSIVIYLSVPIYLVTLLVITIYQVPSRHAPQPRPPARNVRLRIVQYYSRARRSYNSNVREREVRVVGTVDDDVPWINWQFLWVEPHGRRCCHAYNFAMPGWKFERTPVRKFHCCVITCEFDLHAILEKAVDSWQSVARGCSYMTEGVNDRHVSNVGYGKVLHRYKVVGIVE